MVFENYKSLDESSPSGMMEVFGPASGLVAPALAPAVKLYTLMHDILSPEAQLKFCRYFQVMDPKFDMPAWSFQYLFFVLNTFQVTFTGCYKEEVKKAFDRNR